MTKNFFFCFCEIFANLFLQRTVHHSAIRGWRTGRGHSSDGHRREGLQKQCSSSGTLLEYIQNCHFTRCLNQQNNFFKKGLALTHRQDVQAISYIHLPACDSTKNFLPHCCHYQSVVSDYKKSSKWFFLFFFWWKIVASCLQLTKNTQRCWVFVIFCNCPTCFFVQSYQTFFKFEKKHGQQLQRHIAKIWQIEDSYDDEWGSSHKHFGKKQIFLFWS